MSGEIYDKMVTETINGLTLNDLVGGGDPKKIGEDILDFLQMEKLVAVGSKVLEIGCGCGRAAVPLISFLNQGQGHYTGVDIVPGLIEFSRREIASRFRRSDFFVVQQNNPLYDSFIDLASLESDLFAGDYFKSRGPFDLVIAFSVFTHLGEADARRMLSDIFGALCDGGVAAISFFILDDFSRKQVCRGDAQFFHNALDSDGVKIDEYNGPNSAVGFDDHLLHAMISDAGFEGIYSQHAGSWRSTLGRQFQDMIVLKKSEPLPANFDAKAYCEVNPDVAAVGINPAYHYRAFGRSECRQLS